MDSREPGHVARAIAQLGLNYVVLTMVDRDDLLDGGAEHVRQTVALLREYQPQLLVETLVGDFQGRLGDVSTLMSAGPHVFAHNIEVPRRLTPAIRDNRCDYDQSLAVLAHAKEIVCEGYVKSSIMVGMGEYDEEVFETMRDLRAAGVDLVTVGQYLQPTKKHAAVKRYVSPDDFAEYERVGLDMGFAYVASGPLVRSSYHAAEAFVAANPSAGERDFSKLLPSREISLIAPSTLVRRKA